MSKTKLIQTKFLCKSGSRSGSGNGISISGPNSHPTITQVPVSWIDTFIAGKWYDGEYEPWWFEDGFRLNGGHRRYWVINERGEKENIPKAHMNIIFELNIDEMRDKKIDEILNNPNKL